MLLEMALESHEECGGEGADELRELLDEDDDDSDD